MSPQPGEGHDPLLSIGRQKAGGWGLIEVKSEAMPLTKRQQSPDQVQGIVLGTGAARGGGPAGINAYEHLFPPEAPD